ncbi:ATP-grasp fold amidoligase family protein [Actinomycetota bacterium]
MYKIIKKLINRTKKAIKKLLLACKHLSISYKVFTLVELITKYMIERTRLHKKIGYYPDLKNPRSYNEKILWKKIYDRNPLLPVVSDKYRVRYYVKEVLGEKEAEKILIPLFYVTDKPETIPFDFLTEEYVIKPNHASGKIIFAEKIKKQKRYTIVDSRYESVFSDNNQTRSKIVDVCKSWLSLAYNFYKHEWAYQKIERKIVIEKLLRDNRGKFPVNYNFSVFDGKCHLITICHSSFSDGRITRYTADWEYINVQGKNKQAAYEKKPKNLESMIYFAELLGKHFDFIRVDLYCIYDRIYFSELTNYPMSGAVQFNPVSFDFELGSKWTLSPKYWL